MVEIEIKDLWYTYPGRSEPTLKGINLEVREGEFVLLTGPTGCGKSTLLKTLNGIIPHESGGTFSGSIKLKGIETRASNQIELSRGVGLVFQNPDDQIFSTIVEDEVAFGPENLCLEREEIEKRVEKALQAVGMEGHRTASTSSLSGGQKQRICIASMLAMMPEILAMDEPVSQMDPVGTHEVLSTVRELNQKLKMTILLVEHRLHELASFVDRIVIMDNGEIVFDRPASKAFDQLEVFHRLGLRVPEPVELCRSLGIKASPLNAREALTVLEKRNFKGNFKGNTESITEPPLNQLMQNQSVQNHPTQNILNPEKSSDGRNIPGHSDYHEAIHDLDNRNNFKPGIVRNNPTLISVQNLWSGYEKNKMVLKDINLEIQEGERVAIMGTNGSGKSTLLLHFAAILKPYKGSVKIFEGDTRAKNPYIFAGRIGFVFQNPDLMLFCDSTEAEAGFGPIQLKYKDVKERIETSLEAMSLLPFRHDLPQALSRGQRLRTAVASVLSLEPEILLLDEPTTGQDRINIEQMMKYFKKKQTTLVFCTHDVEVALSHATRILVMDEGQIIADGSVREIIKDIKILSKASLIQPPIVEIARNLGIEAFSVKELTEAVICKTAEMIKC